MGEVIESLASTPLKGARGSLLDSSYQKIDSALAGHGFMVNDTQPGQLPPATFSLRIPKVKGKYYIMTEYEGYDMLLIPYDLKKFGKSESWRNLEPMVMTRSPKKLDEVVVTATQVKFYNRGDTLVYNADAFQLAEGSMLDVLINQLPGVELNENGQIYVNGRFVQSLLLDGKEFFNGNNQIMLKNLGAYMVKEVSVYERASDLSRLLGEDAGDNQFVMDVRLKKQYQVGWIANVEPGAGTDGRYLGRLFALTYTPNLRVGVYANANNLNDNQRPGESNSFAADKAPVSGTGSERMAGMTLNYTTTDKKQRYYGFIDWQQTSNTNISNISRVNFLPGGNNYNYSFSDRDSRLNHLSARFRADLDRASRFSSYSLGAEYRNNSMAAQNMSTTFLQEQKDVTLDFLENLYNQTDAEALNQIVNRISSINKNKGHNFSGNAFMSEMIKIPYTNDALQFELSGDYGERRSRSFQSYLINEQSNPVPTRNEGQWFDTHPNSDYTINGILKYKLIRFKNFSIGPKYWYTHSRKRDNLEAKIEMMLADDGIYGLTPPADVPYSPENSYYSTLQSNIHEAKVYVVAHIGRVNMWGNLHFKITNENLSYKRGDTPYSRHRSSAWPEVKDLTLNYGFWKKIGRYRHDSNTITFKYNLRGISPNLIWMLPIVDDTDPMNICVGADDLKNQMNHDLKLSWNFMANAANFRHSLDVGYRPTTNALVRGYTYETSTGVRTIRSYNTSDNWVKYVASRASAQFGKRKEFSISNDAQMSYSHASDMIGTDVITPAQSTVRNAVLADKLLFSWQIGKQNIALKSNLTWRKTSSENEYFTDFNAIAWGYGITGNFRLPANFALSTDFTVYNRWGYAYASNDQHDFVLNARLSYSMMKGALTLMVDGFDLLHQLNNVIYDVNAQGRTVTYTNVVPRYFLFHATYRLNLQPKARRKK